jgi:serine/threonine protein phosphatase PrpC
MFETIKIRSPTKTPIKLQKSMLIKSPNTHNKQPQKIANQSKDHSPLGVKQSNGHIQPEIDTIVKPNIESKEVNSVVGFSHKTRAGKLPTKPFKPNQDSFIIHPNFSGQKDKFIFGVCDGHGANGHSVSGFLKNNLPKNIEIQYKSSTEKDDASIKEMLRLAFSKTTKQLTNSPIDSFYSGSTTVGVAIFGTHLWCANVGDSRAVLAKCDRGRWSAYPLSDDHKPEKPAELARISKCGGRVEPHKDHNGQPLGPHRVWLKNENVPGLAMSRSIGDRIVTKAGVIAEPEIIDLELEEEDKFVVIGSDGLWEFLSNEKIVELVTPFYQKNQLEAACNCLVRTAVECWNQFDNMVDDITCIIISLKVPTKNMNI